MHYSQFGLYAVIVLLVGLSMIPMLWPQNRHHTFSQHVARHKIAIAYYIILFSIALPLLVLFFYKWFTPHVHASEWLTAFVVLAAITQYACTLVPETGGKRATVHRALAGVSGLCLIPSLLIIMASQINGSARLICGVALLAMLICLGLVVKAKGEPRNFLILQSVYFASFFVPMLYIRYL